MAEGELESMTTGNTFIGLKKYYDQVAITTSNTGIYMYHGCMLSCKNWHFSVFVGFKG